MLLPTLWKQKALKCNNKNPSIPVSWLDLSDGLSTVPWFLLQAWSKLNSWSLCCAGGCSCGCHFYPGAVASAPYSPHLPSSCLIVLLTAPAQPCLRITSPPGERDPAPCVQALSVLITLALVSTAAGTLRSRYSWLGATTPQLEASEGKSAFHCRQTSCLEAQHRKHAQ